MVPEPALAGCSAVAASSRATPDPDAQALLLPRPPSADVAEETTRLAKNLLLRDASSSILAQARVNAANVYKSLL